MAEATVPDDVRLICGMICARQELFDVAAEALAREFSAIDIRSEIVDFDFTHYYDGQMGSPLYRRFVSFSRAVKPDALGAAKLAANRLERELAARHARPGSPPRPINLDPGYVDQSKLILASMKDFSHRIYLGQGVYAELTLLYRKAGWEALKWTFPDYASGRYDPFLNQVRSALREHLQSQGRAPDAVPPGAAAPKELP